MTTNNTDSTTRITKEDIQFRSVYFAHSLASFALAHGILEPDTFDFTRMIISRAKEAIVADPRAQVVVTTASGKQSLKTIEDKGPRSKVSGSGVTTKVTVGETKSAFIGESLGADLARIDQSLYALEKLGCAIGWVPVAGSGLVAYLERIVAEFKKQRPETYPSPAPVDTTPVAIQPLVNA